MSTTAPHAESKKANDKPVVIEWLFRNRRTGGITVAQFPNLSLALFLMATAVRMIASPHGTWRVALTVVADVALVWWAGDEVVRGVNPFRRILGGAVLAAAAAGLVVGLLR